MTRQSRYGRGQRLFVSATPCGRRGEGVFEIRESSAEEEAVKSWGPTGPTDDGWVQFDEGQAGGGGGGGGGRSVGRRRPQLNRLGSWPCCPGLGNCSASTVLVVFCVEAPWKGGGKRATRAGSERARVCGAICHGRRGGGSSGSHSVSQGFASVVWLQSLPRQDSSHDGPSNHTTRRSGARIDMGRTSFPSPIDLVVAVDGSNVLRRTRKPCGQSSFPDQRELRSGRADRRAAAGG